MEGKYGSLLRAAKTEILETSFASELEVLTSDLKRLADADRRTRDYTFYGIRRALIEIVARFPVYRTYLGDGEPALQDRTVHDFVASCLLAGGATDEAARRDAELVRRFRRRFQQLTGPVMAKSLEDTLFYRYVRLLSLNEVGGDPH